MVTIINYGLGNIQAFANIYKRLNVPIRVATHLDELEGADKLILPGVGSFDWAMQKLEDSGMRSKLDELVLQKKCPVLGVCVGMQMMAKHSEEGKLPGLGWIDAEVKRFDESQFKQKTHLPHMGWNDVSPTEDSLFKGLDSPRFYFLHSYCIVPANSGQVLATCDYNGSFASAVRFDHIFGVQFHPEKSHQWGIKLLKNFVKL